MRRGQTSRSIKRVLEDFLLEMLVMACEGGREGGRKGGREGRREGGYSYLHGSEPRTLA